MGNNKITMNQAVELFDQQQYREAFAAFAEIYNQSQDEAERKIILGMLDEAFYAPNIEDIQANYNENCSLLADYPYQWGFQKYPVEALPVQIFPVTETEYCLFDKKEQTFSGLQVFNSGQLCDYLFRDLSRPIFRENDCNLYHLQYLEDNVRRSEDYGGDNHIYLYYDGLAKLAPLLFFGELKYLLAQRKPVFLIGEENKNRYPVNFKKEFQIDYTSTGPAPVRVEEVKRVCFWYKHAHSGSGLGTGILGSLNEVQFEGGHNFNAYSMIDGKQILAAQEFRDAITNIDTVYTAEQISEMIRSERYKLSFDGIENFEDFLDWLCQHRPAPHAYTVKELFCGYFLFQYEKRNLNPRIAPMILYDPHTWDPSIYSNMVLSFPYHTVLTCVREPIMTFIRCQQIGLVGWDEFSTKYMLAFDYSHAKFLHPELRPCYYGFRFEDLKTKPEVVCRALCRHLNLPYDTVMLATDAPDSRSGVVIRGFDTTPLHWNLSACLSEFDMVRLKMFYEPIHRYYGYPTFSFQEHPLPESLIRDLFKYPFRFEHVNPQIYGEHAPAQDTLHAWIQEVLQNCWRKEFISPKLIPLEALNEQEQKMDRNEQEQEMNRNAQKQQMVAHKGNRRERRKARKK